MARNELGKHSILQNHTEFNLSTNATPTMSSDDEMVVDLDEPPDLQRTPRPSPLRLHQSFKGSFTKHAPRIGRQESLLSTALNSNNTSPVEPPTDTDEVLRGMSCASTWSNNSASTAELTSDGGFTSPGTRTNSPSPPLPPVSFHNVLPTFKHPFEQPVSIMRHDDENVGPLQKPLPTSSGEQKVEVNLGRKRCITFACGGKSDRESTPEHAKAKTESDQKTEQPKRVRTIKFACPSKVSTDAPTKGSKPRAPRAVSPAPTAKSLRATPKPSPKPHRGSDSTVRNPSPVSVRKHRSPDRSRRLSTNSDLARSEAFRFHEFASSEEEVEEWTMESTCHRRPLTIKDTLVIENSLRQLGEEAEEEALDDEEEDDTLENDDMELDDDEEDQEDPEDNDEEDDSDAPDGISSDEGFQTDNEEGFALSDDESDAGSDYNWWAPGHSTAATSIELLEHIRPAGRRSISESSVGSVESNHRYLPEKPIKRRKARPVNIRIPSPELPDSTDFVCGTLDEDRPLEQAYLFALERRRAAKRRKTPQDVDPTFPTSDPEMEEDDDEEDEPDHLASESDQHFMLHGQMDAFDGDLRGRHKVIPTKRSPAQSPRRLRSPPPAKRVVHRSPPPRKLFGQSPKRMRSPAPIRMRSPPPSRRGSSFLALPKPDGLSIQFAALADRPIPMTTSSLPRTPAATHPSDMDIEDEDTPNEFPVRRAIDIKVGLEKKRQRRKEQLYKKMQQKKGCKEKRPAPGKGCERMREVGLGLAAHKGKATGFAFHVPPTPDQKGMHVLSV